MDFVLELTDALSSVERLTVPRLGRQLSHELIKNAINNAKPVMDFDPHIPA